MLTAELGLQGREYRNAYINHRKIDMETCDLCFKCIL
jgi:hypothetical protein